MHDKANDRLFCWEQVSAANPLFRISRVFAPTGIAERLVPLYALFSAVEQICSTVSDGDVAVSKLAWWRQECVYRDWADSQHPILKELHRSGAAACLEVGDVSALLDTANSRLSARAPSDQDELRKICMDVYRPQLQMELRLCGLADRIDGFDPAMIARNGLMQLLRESLRLKEQGGFWWLPLNLLARHGLSRVDISNRPDSAPVKVLFTEILEGDSRNYAVGDFDAHRGTNLINLRHLFALSEMYTQKLRRLKNRSPVKFNEELRRAGPSDLWAAWKGARKAG